MTIPESRLTAIEALTCAMGMTVLEQRELVRGYRFGVGLTNEALPESAKDVAIAQAVEFALYVAGAAKGSMVERARHFLSLEYAQEVAAVLARAKGQPWNTLEPSA